MLKVADLKTVEKSFIPVEIIMNLAGAAYGVVIPLIIRDILQNDQHVGYYYSFLSILSVVVALLSTTFFQKHNKIRVYKANIFISLLIVFLATIFHSHMSYLILNSVRAFALGLASFSMGFMFREVLDEKDEKIALLDRTRYMAIGSMVGSFASGYLALYFGNEVIFIIAASLMLVAFVLFSRMKVMPILKTDEEIILQENSVLLEKMENKVSLWQNCKNYFLNFQSRWLFILSIFNGLINGIRDAYFPLAVVALQYSQDIIGNVNMVWSLLSFLFLKKLILISSKIGFKNTFIRGWGLGLIFSILAYFSFKMEYALLFFIFHVVFFFGDAMFGSSRRYFFNSIVSKVDQDKFLGIYGLGYRIGSVLGPLLGAGILSISLFVFDDITLKNVWLAISVICLLGVFVSFKIDKKYR